VIEANRFRDNEMLALIDTVGTRNLAWIAATHYDVDHLGAIVDVATASEGARCSPRLLLAK